MADPQEIAKWRRAHQGIEVPDIGLQTMAPFASLYASDFAVYLEASGQPKEFVKFVRDLSKEIAWAYDNWQKAQHDGNPKLIIESLLNECVPVGAPANGGPAPDYSFMRKFLRDWARSHGIILSGEDDGKPSWMQALAKQGGIAEGAGTSSVGSEPIFPPPRPMTDMGGITAPPGPLPEAADAVPDR